MIVKRLSFIIVIVVVSLFLASSAYADGSPFTDVPVDCEYYGAVLDLYDRGIIVGDEQGKFRPDANLTKAEQDKMFALAFKDAGIAWNDQNQDEVTVVSFYSELLRRAGYKPYLPSYKRISEDQLLRAASILCCPQYRYSYNHYDTAATQVSRKEAVSAISRILSYDSLDMIALKDRLRVEVQESFGRSKKLEEQQINDALLDVARLPRNIVDQFNECGYKVVFNDKKISEYRSNHNVNCTAYIDYVSKEICMNTYVEDYAILHEFGHFYNRNMDSKYMEKNNHMEEFEKLLANSLLSDYASTNRAEYFAEYFSLWFLGSIDLPAERMEMAKAGPETFKWFKELESAGWPMESVK